jgi:hypothetical protein
MRTLAGLVLSWLVAGAVAAQPAADPAACTPPGASSPAGEAGAALERGNALAARGESEAARAAFAESRSLAPVGTPEHVEISFCELLHTPRSPDVS